MYFEAWGWGRGAQDWEIFEEFANFTIVGVFMFKHFFPRGLQLLAYFFLICCNLFSVLADKAGDVTIFFFPQDLKDVVSVFVY